MKRAVLLAFIATAAFWAATTSLNAQSGCPGQDPYNCNGCTKDSIYRFRVCIGPVTDTIDVTMCTQYATNQLISNPCTNCTRPLDAITWVRKVCVPPSLTAVGIDTIYRAIVKATSLCCLQGYIPAAIPPCGPGVDTCSPFSNAYCHVVGLPSCVSRSGNCWQSCTDRCRDLCYVERRYCRTPSGACSECSRIYCKRQADCPQGCLPVNCDILIDQLGCCP